MASERSKRRDFLSLSFIAKKNKIGTTTVIAVIQRSESFTSRAGDAAQTFRRVGTEVITMGKTTIIFQCSSTEGHSKLQ